MKVRMIIIIIIKARVKVKAKVAVGLINITHKKIQAKCKKK